MPHSARARHPETQAKTRGPEIRVVLSVWEFEVLRKMMETDGDRKPANFVHRVLLMEARRRGLLSEAQLGSPTTRPADPEDEVGV